MEELMYRYLDEMYPNVFLKKTKFGNVLVGNDAIYYHTSIRNTMVSLFSCNKDEVDRVMKAWKMNRPLLKNIENSTNPDVLVMAETDTNSTL